MPANPMTIPADRLRKYCSRVLGGAGVPPEDADLVADCLVYADLRGVSSHGVSRLDAYLARIRTGLVNLKPSRRIVGETAACALLDAENGLGQPAGVEAVRLAARKAGDLGAGIVSVRNSNHFGAAGWYAEQAAARNMAALVFTNAAPAMPPFNGTRPLLGTNPLAVAVPSADGPSLVLDMATSQVARGKIRRAAAAGESIPSGWAVDKDGRPTTDPNAALKGSLCPLGGPKGSGLSLMIDLLCGVLSGSSLTGEVRAVTDLSGPARTGHLFIVLDPAFFAGSETFLNGVASVARAIRSMPALESGRVFLPGEPETERQVLQKKQGILLPADLVAKLREWGSRHGVAEDLAG